MPRSTKESEDEVETRSGRKTRASALSVPGSPVRRSARKKQTATNDDNSSPESVTSDVTVQTRTRRRAGTLDSVTSETTRSLRSRKNSTASEASEIHESENKGRERRTKKSSLAASGIDTPTNIRLERGARAGSESRTMSPVVRKTRRTRASSVDPEVTDDRPSSKAGTPVKGRKGRAFTFPSEPSVIEETEKLSKHDDDVFETTNTTSNLSTSHGSTNSPERSEKSAVSNDDDVQIQQNDDKEMQEALENSLEALISQAAPEENANPPTNNEKQKLVDNANDNTLRDLPKVLVEKTQLITKPIETMETSPGNKENDITYGQDRKKRSNTARRSSGSLPKKPINITLEKPEIDKHVTQLSRDKLALIQNDSSKSLNQGNVTVSMASIKSQNNEIIVIDDADTDEPGKSHESSKNRRESLRLTKTVESGEVKNGVNEEFHESSEKPEIDDKIHEKLDTNEIDETENLENLFKDISAEEWNEKESKGIGNDGKIDSHDDSDLVLVGKGGWSADEAEDDDNNEDNYDSDVTIIVTRGIDVSGFLKIAKINEELTKIAGDEIEVDDESGELSRESKSIQRKSLTRKSELKSDEKLKGQSVKSSDDSVVPMEVDDNDDDEDSDGFATESKKPADADDSSDDEASEIDAGKSSENLDSPGKPRRSVIRSRDSLKLLDTDTSTDEEEEAEEEKKKKTSEYEDHLNERESSVNKMRKSLNSQSSSDPKKSFKSEVEVGKKKTSEVEGEKSRKSSANEIRRSLTQLSNLSESDVKSSELFNSSTKLRKRTSSGEARSSLIRSSNSSKLLDTDTSTDEGEKAERRKKKMSEIEDHRKKSRERDANKMRKSLTPRSPSDLEKSEDEVEGEKMETSEAETDLDKSRKSSANKVRKSLTQLPNSMVQKKFDESSEYEVEGEKTSVVKEEFNKLRKNTANKLRKSLTQRSAVSDEVKSDKSSQDEDKSGEVDNKTSEVEDSNKSRKSLGSESRKSFTRRQSSSNKKENPLSEDEVEVEDKKTSGIKDNLNELFTHRRTSSNGKNIAYMEDKNEVEEKKFSGEVYSSEEKASLASAVKKSSNKRQSSLKRKEEYTSDEEEEKKTSEVNKSLALEETSEDEESEVSDDEAPLRIDNKSRKLRNKTKSPRLLAMNREVSEEDETSDEVDDRSSSSSSEASKADSPPKKSLMQSKNRKKIEISSSEDEVEEKADGMLNKSRKSSSASEDNDEVSDDDSESAKELRIGNNRDLFKDASTIVQVNSDSGELDDSNDDGGRLFPPYIYDADTTESSNSDIEREYNLNGDEQSYSDDNVSYDECRASESEDDDEDDDGEDLDDFIDDEEEEGEEEEEDDELEEVHVKSVGVKPKQKARKIPDESTRKSEIISTPKVEEEEEDEEPKDHYVESIEVKPKQKDRKIPDKSARNSEITSTSKVEETKSTDSAKKNKKLNSSCEILNKNTSKIDKKSVKPSNLSRFNEKNTRRQTMLVDDPDLLDTRMLMKEKLNESLPSLKLAECKEIPEETATAEKKQKQKKKNPKKIDDDDQDVSKKASLKRKNSVEDEASKKFHLNLVESDSDEEMAEALDALRALKALKNVKKLVDENKLKQHYVSPVIKRPIKRLPEEILENISDVPLRPKKRRRIDNVFVPSRTMFDNGNEKLENMRIDEELIPISFSGSTTKFEVVDLKKRRDRKLKGPKTFRQRAMNRA